MKSSLCRLSGIILLSPFLTFLGLKADPCIPSGATLLTTLDVVVEAPQIDGLLSGSAGSPWHIQESIWQTPSGQIVISIDPTSFSALGSGAGIDQVAWAQIVDVMATEGVLQAIDSGYVACGDSVTVLTSACVTRLGTGSLTTFLPCGPECCTRTYLVTCPEPGVTEVLSLPVQTPSCSGLPSGCESGCEDPPLGFNIDKGSIVRDIT